jgi:hypothetical protein
MYEGFVVVFLVVVVVVVVVCLLALSHSSPSHLAAFLSGMGFTARQAEVALQSNDNDVNRALGMLAGDN